MAEARANRSAASARARNRERARPQVPSADEADRRRRARRNTKRERKAKALAAAPRPGETAEWLPRTWPHVILCMAAAIACAAVISQDLPAPISGAVLAVAVAGACCARIPRESAAPRTARTRRIVTFAFVVSPMMLFGFGMTSWTMRHGLPWDMAFAALLSVGTIAAASLRRQPIVAFAGQFAMWGAVAFAHQSRAGIVTLLVALVVAALVAREQKREEQLEDRRRRASDRVQTRARDILADYEETRQGWFWETDRRGLIAYISRPVADAVGRPAESLIGQPLVELFDLAHSGGESERTLMFHFSARSGFQELPVRAATPGEERWWSVSGRPIFDEFDNFVGFRGSGTDLTEQKRSSDRATHLALFDSLTGLANRFQMSQALEKILAAPKVANRACAVLLLDLDRFKHVNDTMGHPAGDALLKQVGERLGLAVGQAGQVGRLGGDEFEVVVPGPMQRKGLGHLASEIIKALSQPYSIDGQRVIIGASIGIAVSPDDGTTSEELIRNADLALYAAKDGGRGKFHFYAQDLHAEAEARARLEGDLRDAIARGELQLYYQPVVSTATEKIAGFEALLRWSHPRDGWIPPDKFIETAEDSGLIAQIGEWALRTACNDLANWPEAVRVAVNVSPLQFANPQLPAIVTHAIAQAGIDPSRLELEITESVFLNDSEGTDAMFAALKRVGVRLALDDFGTGYSSLGYLRKAPFDKIKIDQSFVRGATRPGSRNGAIIASISSLAQALGMDTTAEGVETMDELELVRTLGCSHVQGYIYEKPLSAEDATARLQSGLAAVANGPRSSRARRNTMLRTVAVEYDGRRYTATIRNMSATGALIEGLWDVPVGGVIVAHLSDARTVVGTARWSAQGRIGVEFETALGQERIRAGSEPGEPRAKSSRIRRAAAG
jgi:diguanylate cyclase (GGDEF)-like protein/PAS domain S-box-containing protein